MTLSIWKIMICQALIKSDCQSDPPNIKLVKCQSCSTLIVKIIEELGGKAVLNFKQLMVSLFT